MRLEIDIPQIPVPERDEVWELTNRVMDAHAASAAQNQCVSSVAVKVCNSGNPGLCSIAAAILTIGAVHGPILDAREVWLKGLPKEVSRANKVPGFGNSFFSEGDPKWSPVRSCLKTSFPDQFSRLSKMESEMFKLSPSLYANAAMYTAITCELLQVPIGQEALLFILPRMPVWFAL
jgi:citrate synthase